jgi:predicted secreted protein
MTDNIIKIQALGEMEEILNSVHAKEFESKQFEQGFNEGFKSAMAYVMRYKDNLIYNEQNRIFDEDNRRAL